MLKIKKIPQSIHTMFKTIKSNKKILIGSLFLNLLIVFSFMMPFFSFIKNPNVSPYKRLQGISWAHWMGTDSTGRDLFSRVIYGAKISLQIAFYSVAISSIIGSCLGIMAGYFRGFFDTVINFVCDILVVFPDFILAIVIMFFLNKSMTSLVIVLSISRIPSFIRVMRANTMQIKQKDFIKTSKALGASDIKIIFRHVLPHLTSCFIIQITLSMSSAILTASGLGFIGLGLDPQIPEWGSILSSSKSDMRWYFHLFLGPFIVIFLTCLSFNLIGSGLMEYFDPKNEQQE
ncbi:ABC transporter permease [Vaccinium witches'-broom phytoplasma]|uniref:ABC transporter permease n=1 Tax=Vaccinium witches'-broom phytoplasma TaxID=85642 RepID=UPI0003823D92|nr:ABC transporter permease [Vaccinium witches'-broom phytoplasma]